MGGSHWLKEVLRAKLVTFLIPELTLGGVGAIGLGTWVQLPSLQIAVALLVVVLALIDSTTLIVWGSVFDGNMNQHAEGTMQTIL